MARDRSIPLRRSAVALLLGGCLGAACGFAAAGGTPADAAARLAALKDQFRRPAGLPAGVDVEPARVKLGSRLFADPGLSVDGTVACATCHNPTLGFADGAARGQGVARAPLGRHTPTLWNLAWTETLFWDGRAASLEGQVRGPLENPVEMGAKLDAVSARLGADPAYAADIAAAFPAGRFGGTEFSAAIAAYERTLVSPKTRFDRWIEGDETALDASEVDGFRLFNGAAGCARCHTGWAFTDRAYHDIGLPGDDPGRGAVLKLPEAQHAFRTPGLRELAWTAPYMHDGSLATLDAVLDHYERGIVQRPSLSSDLPRISLTPQQRTDLLAFLDTLSSEDPPSPAALASAPAATAADTGPEAAVLTVSQHGKAFSPGVARVARGAAVTFLNDDTRTHNVRSDDPDEPFNGGAQEPGQSFRIALSAPGLHRVYCGIHPAMQLTVAVDP